ncbi:hypothetical protein FHX42_000115 [Saccharopolyspora lacisalsi]|uniref:Uncharacterized protein n=1 Tax=Halosaccharopolyspora lacisalsi TaxID=1000566 RepID=A0A839DR74_9PSEU|nr:hypothetical protein [Halosaccharopolyspora lacisalsi]
MPRSRKFLLSAAVAFSVVAVLNGVLFLVGLGAESALPLVGQGGSAIVFAAMATTHGASYARARRAGGSSG